MVFIIYELKFFCLSMWSIGLHIKEDDVYIELKYCYFKLTEKLNLVLNST